ncbi:MAG: conjugal transfer protein TraX, partial [Treponema sp.]|nr:conjugal transfer protein TraX [Treponema sp.]
MERNLNSNHLKLIAIAAMTLDHAAWIFFPGFSTVWYVMIFHAIGRITAPIMWFFISEGFHYTHNVKKYALRLFIFAVISHFPYNYLSGHSFIPCVDSFFNQTSVIWALFWGLILLIFCTDKKNPVWAKILF